MSNEQIGRPVSEKEDNTNTFRVESEISPMLSVEVRIPVIVSSDSGSS